MKQRAGGGPEGASGGETATARTQDKEPGRPRPKSEPCEETRGEGRREREVDYEGREEREGLAGGSRGLILLMFIVIFIASRGM